MAHKLPVGRRRYTISVGREAVSRPRRMGGWQIYPRKGVLRPTPPLLGGTRIGFALRPSARWGLPLLRFCDDVRIFVRHRARRRLPILK